MSELYSKDQIPWWDEDAASPMPSDPQNGKLATAVVECVQDIERRQTSIFDGNRRHAKLISGYLPSGLQWGAAAGSAQRVPFEATKNVARSLSEAATALIVRSRPKPSIVTDGGDWKVQRQAEDLDQFLVGDYHRSNAYQVFARCFQDSTVFGSGFWKYVTRGSGADFVVDLERVLPDDMVVDEEECRDGLIPLCMYHRMMVRADALIAKYAKGDTAEDARKRERIQKAKQSGGWPTRHVPTDRVVLVEAFYVNPDDPSKNRRVLCIPGLVLADADWPFDFHPFTTLRWALPLSGFYGDGIAYRQYGRQQRITYMYRWIQRVHDLFATPRAWLPTQGAAPTMQLSNEIGAVIMSNKPPVFQVQDSCPPEIYKWLNELEQGGYEDEGMSQTSAQNQLPTGVESAPAQREYSFKEGQRFAPVSQRWEDAVAIETADKKTAMYKHHYGKSGVKPKMRWIDRKLMFSIDWPEMERDAYVIRAEASSLESLSPAARTQGALELAQTGWIKPEEGRALVGHPDLKEADELDNAPYTYAKFVLRKLFRNEHVQVDEFADFTILHDTIRKGYQLAIQRGATPEDMRELCAYLDDLDTKMQEAQAAAMPPPMTAQPASAMAPESAGGPVPYNNKRMS